MLQLGFVSAILPELNLEEVLRFAGEEGFDCVELMCWPVGKAERRYAGVTHIDCGSFKKSDVARIKDASVAEVRAAVDMVELVSQYTPLRKVGGRYTGRCPFHDERTPSFSVNAVDKLYHCFGCGKGGDAITFVRESEQLDFAEAITWLAERFGVTLEYEESSPKQEEDRRRKERLYAVLEQASLKATIVVGEPEDKGGRRGMHTRHLQPLLDEMGEVYRTDPGAAW